MSDLLALFLELQQAGAETRAARLAALPDEQRDLLERMLRADEEDTDERWLGAVDEEAAAGELPAGLPKRYESSTTPPARGGMGVVHRVRDAQLERHVALKLAHPALLLSRH